LSAIPCQGDVRLIRYVDGIEVGFEKLEEAEQFQEALRQRLAMFGLELNTEKTRLIECGRFARERRRKGGLGKPESCNVLGFTHICAKSRKGKFQMERRTIAQRFRTKLAESKAELRRRRRLPVPGQGAWLRSVLQGHYRYDGGPLNGRALQRLRKEGARMWQRMTRYVDQWLPVARIYHPWSS
jgi:hypothetical protein